jgi:ABC-type polysaccharide/polyol phosphate export permease
VQRIIGQIHQWAARLFLAGLLLQFYLASTPLFGAGSFQAHRMLGAALTALVILFPLLALVGRLGRQLIGLSTLLLVLALVQMLLPSLRGAAPWIAALHPLNGLVLMGISARIGRNGRAEALQVNKHAARATHLKDHGSVK